MYIVCFPLSIKPLISINISWLYLTFFKACLHTFKLTFIFLSSFSATFHFFFPFHSNFKIKNKHDSILYKEVGFLE